VPFIYIFCLGRKKNRKKRNIVGETGSDAFSRFPTVRFDVVLVRLPTKSVFVSNRFEKRFRVLLKSKSQLKTGVDAIKYFTASSSSSLCGLHYKLYYNSHIIIIMNDAVL
jgi:hypothetical protein